MHACALQGFATGDLDKDAYAPRLFVEKGLEIMVSQSYSKNLGKYLSVPRPQHGPISDCFSATSLVFFSST